MKIFSCLVAVACLAGAQVAGASGTEVAFDESDDFASLDTRTDVVVRELSLGADLQSVACNNAAEWTAGGLPAEEPGTIRVSRMYGADADDPSDWVVIAVDSESQAASAEATVLWQPTLRRLFRVEMLVDGTVVQTSHFNLLNATDLADGRSPVVADGIVIETPEVSYTGGAVRPDIVVYASDGETPLVEGRDYLVTVSNNVEIGTADLTVEGVGDYSAVVKKTFEIVSSVPIEKAADEMSFAGLDSRTNELLVVTAEEWQPVAWNNSETFVTSPYAIWLPGGSDDETLAAVVTAVKLGRKSDEPDWTHGTVVSDGSAEGFSTWCPPQNGWWAFRLTVTRSGVDEPGCFVRRIKFGRNGLLLLLR